MSLTDTFVRKVNSIKKTGDKNTDGDGMYLLVTPATSISCPNNIANL